MMNIRLLGWTGAPSSPRSRPRRWPPRRVDGGSTTRHAFDGPRCRRCFSPPSRDYAADLSDVVLRGMRELGVDVAGKRVLLKPNLVEYEPGAAINTNPSVIVGAAIAMRQAGAAEVVVGEGPGHQRDIEYLLTATGLSDHLREHRIRFVDLNTDDVEWRELASNFSGIGRMALPASVAATRTWSCRCRS